MFQMVSASNGYTDFCRDRHRQSVRVCLRAAP
jgi:hypothetical protein